ncbi:MAG: nuclear transport factor 2 family protein [Acidimicrobiia bacterium]|nr:nuclear transport factor 2 family protein [Acidimicrobiia bacterium]MCY4457255.1 nuclear transport factor 2 family protein [Acidimicrobiaceae bacterium]
MSHENENLVKTLWHHIWIDRCLERLGEVLADPFVRHTRDGTEQTTPQRYASHVSSTVETLRSTGLTFYQLSSVDDLVFARFVLEGVNVAIGCEIRITWLAHYRIAAGRIAELWVMHQADLDW